jgi:lipid II:glycine glycyltransferase (peptidoglycan interpeptide bridge formation enzyme)
MHADTESADALSDNDAPEEISLVEAKRQTLDIRKAEIQSKQALADKKKLVNVRKEEIIRSNKSSAKKVDFLPTEVLEDLAPDDETVSKPKRKRESKKTLSTKREQLKKIVKNGYTIQKLGSEEGLISNARKAASQDATDLLSNHFQKIQREDYFKVYSRQSGPAKRFEAIK